MEKKTIGSFIAALRKASGMTQKELAERLNVSDKTVSRWERDDGAPDLSAIPVIAEVFGVTCDELLRGQRKSPEQQAQTPENTPTPKGEKERQRLLAVTLSKYKTRSMVAVCVALTGMLVAMAGNFGFNRAYLGFLAGCGFFLAAAAAQAIFVNGAFLSVAEEEDAGAFKRQVVALAEGVWTLTAVLLAVCLPLVVFVYDSYAGLTGGAWLFRGGFYGFAALSLCAVVLWLVNGRLVKQGVYTPKSSFAHNHRWQKNCALLLTVLLAVTFACQWGLNQFVGVKGLAEWQSFDDLDSFKAFMEQDVAYDHPFTGSDNTAPVPDDTVVYYDQYGSEISWEEAVTEHLYEADRIVLTYHHLNDTVNNIRYDIRDGQVLFLEVLTWDEYYRGRGRLEAFNVLFGCAYAVEYGLALILYIVKRKKV